MADIFPTYPRYRNDDKPDLQPDYVLEDLVNGFIYICHKFDSGAAGEEANALDIWRICRVQTITTPTDVTTIFTYPQGCAGYNFNLNEITSYTYKYKQ